MTREDLIATLVPERRQARFAQVAAQRLACLTLVCDRIVDPHNLSACIRSADAFGVGIVHALWDRDWNTEINSEISMKADQWVDCREHRDETALVDELRGAGFTLVGTVVPEEGAMPCHELPLPPKLALVIGSERQGMSAGLREACDHLITIPTYGFVDSLNLSVAAAILLQRFSGAYRTSHGDAALIPADMQQRLVDRWCDRELYRKLHAADNPDGRALYEEVRLSTDD